MPADSSRFKTNDWVIFTREKHGLSPGKRAKNISPAPHGELYSYEVDKYWIVREVAGPELVLETRTGKRHRIAASDPRLRSPNLFEKWWYSSRFPVKNTPQQQTDPASLPTPPTHHDLAVNYQDRSEAPSQYPKTA